MQIYLHQETNHPVFSLQNQLLSQTKTEEKTWKKITQTLNGTQCSTSGPFSRHPVLFFLQLVLTRWAEWWFVYCSLGVKEKPQRAQSSYIIYRFIYYQRIKCIKKECVVFYHIKNPIFIFNDFLVLCGFLIVKLIFL